VFVDGSAQRLWGESDLPSPKVTCDHKAWTLTAPSGSSTSANPFGWSGSTAVSSAQVGSGGRQGLECRSSAFGHGWQEYPGTGVTFDSWPVSVCREQV